MLQNFDLTTLIIKIPCVLWAISFHEFCHGYAAKLLGDRTAEMQGRLSLNPLSHFDPIGALMLLLVGFGWAKPVPVNSRYFKNVKRDMIIVSLAGIAGNLLTAFVFGLIMRYGYSWLGMSGIMFTQSMIFINIGLAAFNILPIPPLDGSKVLYGFLPFSWLRGYYWLEQYGFFVLLILLLTGAIDIFMRPIMGIFLQLVFFYY